MRKVSELGYHAVEVSQIPMTPENVSELKRASEDFDIKIAAMSAGLRTNAARGARRNIDKMISKKL